jgi:hypothetical protein
MEFDVDRINNFTWLNNRNDWNKRIIIPSNTNSLKEIINLGVKVLKNKMSGGVLYFNGEKSMQLHLSVILNTIGKLFENKFDDIFNLELESSFIINQSFEKSGSHKAKIDITLCFGNKEEYSTAAIELKYFKKSNQREPNNRYDVFCDLSNLEKYKMECFDLCYFLILTDHEHYVNQEEYSEDTKDFDFRNGKKYIKNTVLTYNAKRPGRRTESTELYGPPIKLNGNYDFNWEKIIVPKEKKFYMMLLEC